MGRRNTLRLKVVLPVRVWGNDAEGRPFAQMVHTLDVSRPGARLAGFKGALKAGETIGVQYKNYKVRFRVAWVKDVAGKELQFGVESLQPDKDIWGVELPAAHNDDYVVPTMAPPTPRKYEKRNNDRRRHTRYPVSGTAVVSHARSVEARGHKVSDISLEGCYVESDQPYPVDTSLKLLLTIQNVEIEAFGIVRASFPRSAMGVQFTQLSSADEDRLKGLIKRLEAEEARSNAPVSA